MSVHEHHIYVLEKDNSCKQDILTDISVYIYRLLYRYTVLLYKTCTDELYFCLHNSYKRDTHTHTHTDIALYIYRFMQRYTVLLYTSCTDGLYLCVHNCTLLYNLTLPKHTIVVHTLCSDQLYCCTFILLSILCTLWDYCVHNCTVQLYTRQYQPGLCFVNQSQKSFDLPALL